MFAASAFPLVLRFPTPTDVPTECGSPMSSALRRLSTVLRAMFTSVQDVSVPTRLSVPSDIDCAVNYGITSCDTVFYFLLSVFSFLAYKMASTFYCGGHYYLFPRKQLRKLRKARHLPLPGFRCAKPIAGPNERNSGTLCSF